jgi:hypothetical protein
MMAAPESAPVLTGGCQCGAVRYALYRQPEEGDICHCRMCQKALGNLFAAYAQVPMEQFAWTRGRPALFKSSSAAERTFCKTCGTPLSFRYPAKSHISVLVGSLDEPERAKPTSQFGIESRISWLDEALTLPGTRTEDDPPPGGLAALQSYQHPDRETTAG